jgi:type I restriction enzyme S subunit
MMEGISEKTSDLLKIDRSKWELVKFGDVAIQQKGTVDRENTELTRYVKGEHMGSEDLHLREWGELQDEYLGPAFIRKFNKGDILYGSRRTYLRKVVIAPFDGITSNTTFVIKANEKRIVKQLLPFIMMSEGFTNNSVKNSKGSVNPYINWKDIANYEFLLPPKSDQAHLAELLWAMDEVIEKEREVLERLENTYSILIDNLFTKENTKWIKVKCLEIADINKNSLKNNHNPEYEFKYLDIAGIVEPKIMGNLQTIKFKNAPSRARRITRDNSIVLSLVRPYFKAFVHLSNSKDIIASTGTAVIDVKKDHNSRFIFHQFFSSRFMKFCEDRMTGTNYPAITPSDLHEFEIFLPNDFEVERSISEQLDQIDNTLLSIKSHLIISKSLQKSLINQVF